MNEFALDSLSLSLSPCFHMGHDYISGIRNVAGFKDLIVKFKSVLGPQHGLRLLARVIISCSILQRGRKEGRAQGITLN